MKSLIRMTLLIASLLLALTCLTVEANRHSPQQKARQVWLRLKTGPILKGAIVKIDSESVDFTVKGILQSVPCDDLIGAMVVLPFAEPAIIRNHSPPVESSPSPFVLC